MLFPSLDILGKSNMDLPNHQCISGTIPPYTQTREVSSTRCVAYANMSPSDPTVGMWFGQ